MVTFCYYLAMPKQTRKFCRTCEKIKAIGEFYKGALHCRACWSLGSTYVLRPKEWASPYPKGKCRSCGKKLGEFRDRYNTLTCRECSLIKMRARTKTKVAIKQGLLVPPIDCNLCQERPYNEVHHPDYSKPLVVLWLCTRCHRRTHENIRRVELGKKPIPLEYW